MEPTNFQFADPSAAILNGIKTSAVLGQMQQEAQQRQLAQQQAAQQQAVLQRLAMNPDATHADYAQAMTLYPAMAENLGRAHKVLSDGQQQNTLNFLSRAHAALFAGNTDLAAQMYEDRAKAEQNPGERQHLDMMGQLIRSNPSQAKAVSALGMAAALGADKFATALPAIGKETRDAEQGPAELRKKEADATTAEVTAANAPEAAVLGNQNISSQIQERGARLGLDRDKLATETQLKLQELGLKSTTLNDSAQKIINDSTMSAVTAEQSAAQMRDLADQLERGNGTGGIAGGVGEWLKSATGSQDAVTSLRQEYVRVRNSAALKMLPPGPASDKDIQVAMKGFPPETADAAYMASFLRGLAKMQQRDAVVESARAEWVNSVGHNGRAKTDISVDGVKVPAGTTFPDFMREYLPKAISAREAQQAPAAAVQGRSYMRFAAPTSGRVPGVN